jgi:hypothetical protein
LKPRIAYSQGGFLLFLNVDSFKLCTKDGGFFCARTSEFSHVNFKKEIKSTKSGTLCKQISRARRGGRIAVGRLNKKNPIFFFVEISGIEPKPIAEKSSAPHP